MSLFALEFGEVIGSTIRIAAECRPFFRGMIFVGCRFVIDDPGVVSYFGIHFPDGSTICDCVFEDCEEVAPDRVSEPSAS